MDIDVLSLKEYYLDLLFGIKEDYEEIYTYFQKSRSAAINVGIKLTTNDAHTLTDGPTIFLAEKRRPYWGILCGKRRNTRYTVSRYFEQFEKE